LGAPFLARFVREKWGVCRDTSLVLNQGAAHPPRTHCKNPAESRSFIGGNLPLNSGMRPKRFLCLTLFAAAPILSQDRASSPLPPSLPNHGLVLTIARDARPDPSPPDEMHRCLASHPALACVGFTMTLDNNGSETMLFSWVTCPQRFPEVEYKASDGTWKPFPERPIAGVCLSTIGGFGLIHPGKGSPTWLRLAYMNLAAAFPDPAANPSGPRQASGGGYKLLTGSGPFIIRLRQRIGDCVTRQLIDDKDLPTPGSGDDVSRFCDPTAAPIGVLESNELELTAPSAPR
jgi:hypothetical protein